MRTKLLNDRRIYSGILKLTALNCPQCSSVSFSTKALEEPISPPQKKTFQIPPQLNVHGRNYETDDWTNLTPKILSLLDRNLLREPSNPLNLLRQRICSHFDERYRKQRSSLFSCHEIADPVVTVHENFDSLLVPENHVSRSRSDSYYVNKTHLLRAHTSAHQHSLISSGRDAFLMMGSVFRRDQIDRTHFPVFHQMEGVRLFSPHELARVFGVEETLGLVETTPDTTRRPDKQETHTVTCSKLLEQNLKKTLEALMTDLWGPETECRWIECYFPFTHPSWELEVRVGSGDGEESWMETLGCGIVEQKLLTTAGAADKVGWAFGLGLERIAMKLYQIPDIRLFWSQDTGFLSQFEGKNPKENIAYKCINDISFWLPDQGTSSEADFNDLVRSLGGDLVEQVRLVDDFVHPKTKRRSHCYRIVYRHPAKTLVQSEVNEIHMNIGKAVEDELGGHMRVPVDPGQKS